MPIEGLMVIFKDEDFNSFSPSQIHRTVWKSISDLTVTTICKTFFCFLETLIDLTLNNYETFDE